MADSRMSPGLLPDEFRAGLNVRIPPLFSSHSLTNTHRTWKPDLVAPLVLVLTHPDGPDVTGRIFESGGGFTAEIRWDLSDGVSSTGVDPSPERGRTTLRCRGRLIGRVVQAKGWFH